MMCSYITELSITLCHHIGGIFNVNKNCLKMPNSKNSHAKITRGPYIWLVYKSKYMLSFGLLTAATIVYLQYDGKHYCRENVTTLRHVITQKLMRASSQTDITETSSGQCYTVEAFINMRIHSFES